MSESRVELLRGLNVAFNERGDWLDFYAPEVEFHMPPEWPEDPVYRGEEGLREAVRLWTESFDEYRWDEKRLIDAPPDGVVGLYEQRGRIKQGGTWIEQAIGVVFRFRGGKIVRADAHFSWAAALEAAGVSDAQANRGE
jgi:ketosteroid isomerase-like protein